MISITPAVLAAVAAAPAEAESLVTKVTGWATFGATALAALAALIVVHEYGHFLAGRLVGARIEKFSIGFGKAIFKTTSNGVEYVLAWIPLGGFVKFYGDELDPGDSNNPDHFLNLPVWKRWVIVAAGPAFNFLLALAILTLIGLIGVPTPTLTVGKVVETSSAAAAGLAPGDTIVFVDGAAVAVWEDLETAILARTDATAPLTLDVDRSGGQAAIVFTPDTVGKVGIQFVSENTDAPPTIAMVFPGQPAFTAGFLPGDVVLTVDGVAATDLTTTVEAIQRRPGRPVPVTIDRGGATLTLTVTPTATPQLGFIPVIGETRYGPVGALVYGVEQSWHVTVQIFESMMMLVKREIPANQLAGPIGIMKIAGDAAENGALYLMKFIALISINLGVLNLLPIPILDGGHLVFFTLEGLMGRPVNLKMQEMAQQVGIVALISLMAFAFYNDLVRLLG
jgi:regulator of sigma E protease